MSKSWVWLFPGVDIACVFKLENGSAQAKSPEVDRAARTPPGPVRHGCLRSWHGELH